MSYYRGDWYRGDYYQGDPGFFSTIAKIGGSALGFLPGIGPAAKMIAGTVANWGGGGSSALVHTPIAAAAGKQSAITSLASKAIGAVRGHPVLSAAGGAGLVAGGAGALMARGAGAMVPGQRGFHMSKPRKGVAPHMVRNRRMNPCNPRALRRAIRRTHGFAKLAMRTIHIVHPKKKGRFGGFRRRRTRARS